MGAVPEQQRSSYLMAIWAVVAALIVSYLVIFGLSAAARLRLPAEVMYGESIVLDLSRRVARGEELYPAPDRVPLVVTAYMPAYYLLVGGLERAFGTGYEPGRVVSLAAALGSALAIVVSVHCVGGRRWAALLAGGFFLTQNMTVLLWAPLHRVDLLALCLTVCGLACVTAGRVRVAAILLVLAVATKQSYLVAPVAVIAALWPDRRSLLWFGGIFLGGLGAVVVGACFLTGGWFLWHTVIANANPFDEDNLRAMLGAFLHFNGVPILAATALFALPSRPGERLWRCYFLGTLLSVVGFGKIGASSNYWLELTAATAVLIGLLVGRLAAEDRPTGAITETGLALLVAGSLLIPIPGYQAVVREALRSSAAATLVGDRGQLALASTVAAEPGEVLTDEPALAVAAGKPVAYEFVIFDLLVGQGLWDDRPILDAVEARRFGLVILSTPLEAPPEQARWSPALVAALRASYTLVGPEGNYWLYRPVGRREAAPDASGGSLVSGHGSEQ
jgi:hypothetical protein